MIREYHLSYGKPICLEIALLLMGTLVLQSGCQFAPSKPSLQWPWKKETPAEVPDRILAVWSDSVLHQPGQPGVRGFGGRLYFYKSQGSDPIDVDGGLAVYVFDADELDPYKQQPLRKFVFTPEQFVEHKSKTDLGSSYSVWLPWDEVGGQARRLSLISRFQGSQGGIVISEPVIKLLPGVPKNTAISGTDTGASDSPKVQMVGHQQHSIEPVVSQEQLTRSRATQTIDLPPGFHKYFTNGHAPETSYKPESTHELAPRSNGPSQNSTAPTQQSGGNQNSDIVPNESLPAGLQPDLASQRSAQSAADISNSIIDQQNGTSNTAQLDPQLTKRMQKIRQARTISSPR